MENNKLKKMKTMKIATIKKNSLHSMPVFSYQFIELKDKDNKLVYQRIVNGKVEQAKKISPSFSDDRGIIPDARKAIYQKFLRGVGFFDVEIFLSTK